MDSEQKAYLIDQAVSIDLPVRRVVRQLYDAALNAASGKPLCLTAAHKIAETADKGDYTFVFTGFPIPPMNIAETDGPPGAAVLVKTLKANGLKPVLVTDELCSRIVKAAAPKIKVIEFSISPQQAQSQAEQLLQEYNPAALVAIERPGWNSRQEYHNMRGLSISNIVGKTDYLFRLGQRRGALTVGVGDGGNELGCGLILQAVRKHVPYGAECQCPCKAGIAAATPADHLVVSGVSNWGAYGVAACLSMLNDLDYSHNRQKEMQLLNKVVKAGAIDGILKEPKPYVDGLSPSLNGLVVDLISTIINA